MLNKLIKEFFSMRMMSLGLLLFLVAIAKATFIESDFGTPASKIAIYNAWWFELLLLYLSISLVVNIFRYNMFKREKIAMLSFHLSFLLIILGAAFTRYVGYEGSMPILEGQTTNIIYSADPYFVLRANDQVNLFEYNKQKWMSEGRENPFNFDIKLPNQDPVKVDYISYKENFLDSVIQNDSVQGKGLEFVVRGESVLLLEGEEIIIGGLNFSFNVQNPTPGVKIWEENKVLYAQSIKDFSKVNMAMLSREDQANNFLDENAVSEIVADSTIRFESGKLYMLEDESVMFRGLKNNISRTRVKAKQRDEGTHYLTIKLTAKDGTEKLVELPANHDRKMDPIYFAFAGLNYEVAYGAKPILLPFYITCRDFQLDKYPGSTLPSSFASEITILDSTNNYFSDARVFMNNVLDYSGFRFFQSSYFPDESGTVLSVNYDFWGTNITYLGYLLMTIGMAMSLFAPVGRFTYLNDLIKKSRENRFKMLKTLVLLIGLSFSANQVYAHNDHDHKHSHDHQHDHDHEHHHDHEHNHDHDHAPADASKFEKPEVEFNFISTEASKSIADLLVQDYEGRIIPFHTLSDKILRKVYYDNKYMDKNPIQVLISMHLFGYDYWYERPVIFVSSKIREALGVTEKHVALKDVETEDGAFKWAEEYNNAFEKPESKKSEFDKQLIKLGERYRVLKEVFAFKHLRIVPIPEDPNGTWVWPFSIDLKHVDAKGNDLAASFLSTLFNYTQNKLEFAVVEDFLEDLKAFQWETIEGKRSRFPSADLPTKRQINAEITYNEINAFDRIKNLYFISGFLMLILYFIRVLSTPTLKKESMFKKLSIPFFIFIFGVFILHGTGLGFRWYISGHAPWSNGYEAVIFIAWATVLAGLMFIRKNPAVLPATALLAGLMLFVTELNLLDPEITPLQPVLKSYWLMIHVAIITASYGFLGLSAILGIVNLKLFLFKNKNNKKRLSMNINELTAVSEMTMTIGLFMLTIGTFLGGVWANESWGRYWGWDPKETWALVSVLAYAIIIHLRFIPKLGDRFIFNATALWGFSAILFTFFGVNFKLVGLHSYAQGDGVAETPSWVIVTVVLFALFTIAALFKNYFIDKQKLR